MKTLSFDARRNLLTFIKSELGISEEFGFLGEDEEEIKIVCPFCGGGHRGDATFDLNIVKGVGRCWRANHCDWRGSVYNLVMDLKQVDFKTAKNLIDSKDYSPEFLKMCFDSLEKENKEEEQDDGPFLVEYDGDPIQDSPKLEEVIDWLIRRGYDPDKFMSDHEMFWPVQDFNGFGRVGFRVSSLESSAFQLYTYDKSKQDLKTYNPKGSYLSKLLYNYNNVYKNRDTIFVTEGIFDCARLMSWGLDAVCIFGVNLSEEQIALLYTSECEEICVCLDNGTHSAVYGSGKSPGIIKNIRSVVKDKYISAINIEKEGADPDSLTRREFLLYYDRRREWRPSSDRKSVV